MRYETLAQSVFSHKELQNKKTDEVMDLLVLQKNINWNDLKTKLKRGSCCYRYNIDNRNKWKIEDIKSIKK